MLGHEYCCQSGRCDHFVKEGLFCCDIHCCESRRCGGEAEKVQLLYWGDRRRWWRHCIRLLTIRRRRHYHLDSISIVTNIQYPDMSEQYVQVGSLEFEIVRRLLRRRILVIITLKIKLSVKKAMKWAASWFKLTIHQGQRHPSRQSSAFWEVEAISRQAWDKSKSKDLSEYEWQSWRTTRPSYQNRNLALKGPKIWREVHNSPRHWLPSMYRKQQGSRWVDYMRDACVALRRLDGIEEGLTSWL